MASMPHVTDPGSGGNPQAVSALCQVLLQGTSGEIRKRAARDLGSIGGPEAIVALIKVLSDPVVAHAAASALGECGEEARGPLGAILDHPDPTVRYWALYPLRWLAGEQQIDLLRSA